MSIQIDSFVEKVPPANARGEDPIIVGVIIAVLCCAALLLWLRQPYQGPVVERVPDGARQVLTELSVAATEIKMIVELDGEYPSMAELLEMGVTPFANEGRENWVEAQSGCYLGVVEKFNFRLIVQTAKTDINWRRVSNIVTETAAAPLDSTLCKTEGREGGDGNWEVYSPLQSKHNSTNDKHPHS